MAKLNNLDLLTWLPEKDGESQVKQSEDNECFMLPLPTVEQMRKDVANATYELQQAFIHPQNQPEVQNTSENHATMLYETPSASNEDPLRRTKEETVCEELIINGKRYRHTFQKKVVLQSQKTREIFVLPSGIDTEGRQNGRQPEGCASSNFDRYNEAFEGNTGRLDLQVLNQEGSFSPILVIPPQAESPRSVGSPSSVTNRTGESEHQDKELLPANLNPSVLPNGKLDVASTVPLVINHMYHFGEWDKTSSILDPRLPASLGVPINVSQQEDSIFCLVPAEWHHSDITYGREVAGAPGTTAKARIVACLQRFTQRSAQTGKELYRSTYVQHTKIARWRRSEKYAEIPPASSVIDESSKAPSLSPENEIQNVANVSDVWKQVTRSPLGGEEGGVIAFPRLRPCSYDRLQLLKFLCPVAAAAMMILSQQMPEMRENISPMPTRQTSIVTADAWCPRTLISPDNTEDSLLFSTPDGVSEAQPSAGKEARLLRGGTLDGLLVYALNIFRQNKPDTYENLIPNIFMRLYPTFAVVSEVVSRLIHRYLSLAPIEPGGLGGIKDADEKENETEMQTVKEFDKEWNEAISTLNFLLKLLTRTERALFDSKLKNKLVKFALLLQLDSQIVACPIQSSNTLTIEEDETDNISMIPDDVSARPDLENAVSIELNRVAKCLLDLMSPSINSELDTGVSNMENLKISNSDNEMMCTCYQRLCEFLQIRVRVLAEQITAMEEVFFDNIQIYELINIKNLEKGNTPTLSRCVQYFNDLNFMVKCLTLIAKEFGQPSSGLADTEADAADTSDSNHACCLCGLQRGPLLQKHFMEDNYQRVRRKFVASRKSIVRRYLCVASASHSISVRVRRINYQLENTLVHLCNLAEELKRMNNFSSFLAVILGLQNAPTQNVCKRTKCRLNELSAYMLPPSFSTYRRDLEASKMPCLPYLGLVFQQLIHLDIGNLIFLPPASDQGETFDSCDNGGPITGDEADANKIVNFWRCWKHYLILGYFMKKTDDDMLGEDEKGSYEIEPDPEIQSYLNSFKIYSSKLGQKPDSYLGQSNRCNLKKQRSKSVSFHTLP